jgi:HSP20 family protein
MRLTRWREGWNPWRELEEMSSRLERAFGRFPGGEGESRLAFADWTPTVNISETEKEYRLAAELPQVEPKDVKVTLDEGMLTIEGKRESKKEEKGEKLHRVETSYGTFLRRFALPEDADPERVSAKYENGMLNIAIAKSEAAAPRAPRTIPVKS